MRVLIVGGVAGGMGAATRLRRQNENAEIIVFERGPEISFANCGLPYHLSGIIPERDQLILQTPKTIGDRFGVDVRVLHEVVSINPGAKSIEVKNLTTGEVSVEQYDSLVLSPGAAPIKLPIPGAERALSLRDLVDLDAIVAALDSNAKSAAILGAGFIGLEIAENLVHRGMQVTLVEATDQILARQFDIEMARPVANVLQASGVDVRLGVSATEITATEVVLSDGSRVDADIVISAVGVRPESNLARAAGLEIGEQGGIVVDDHLRTSDPNIYALGDAVEKKDSVDGSTVMVPLAQTANRNGRLVADIISGRDVKVMPVLGSAIVGVFGLTIASTGWNEKRLIAAGRNYQAIHTHPDSHAGYYPGSQAMSLKLLFDPETDEILGAQGVGGEGVDKRIDVIATAMRGGLKATDLMDLELTYAPQFSSAKDPVNMLGMYVDNLNTKMVKTVQWHEVVEAVKNGDHLIDVRPETELGMGGLPNAIVIPIDELRGRISEIPQGDLIVCDATGAKAIVAARMLEQHGRNVRVLDGGLNTLLAALG